MSTISRRTAIAGFAAAGFSAEVSDALAQGSNSRSSESQLAQGVNAMIPPGYLHVIGLLIRDTGEPLPAVIDWYETTHSREAAYQWAFETRYARNYITRVEEGPKPPYRVVLELWYKNKEAADKLRSLMKSGLAQPNNGSMAEQAQKWGFIRNIYSVMFPVDIVPIRPTVSSADAAAPLLRRLVLLRRTPSASQSQFEAEVKKVAEAITELGADVGSSIQFRRETAPSDDAPDAIVFVDNAPNAKLPRPDDKIARVANIFAVEMRKSPVEMASP